MALRDADISLIQGNTKPVSVVISLIPLSSQPLKVANAAVKAGMGVYTLSPTFSLPVPPSTYVGSYVSIVTVTATAAP